MGKHLVQSYYDSSKYSYVEIFATTDIDYNNIIIDVHMSRIALDFNFQLSINAEKFYEDLIQDKLFYSIEQLIRKSNCIKSSVPLDTVLRNMSSVRRLTLEYNKLIKDLELVLTIKKLLE